METLAPCTDPANWHLPHCHGYAMLQRRKAPERWTIGQQLRSILGATVRFVSNGCRFSTAELVAHRQSICNACPHWQGGRCAICGCGGIKLDFPAERCPDNPPRWGAVTADTTPLASWAVSIPTVPRKTVTINRTVDGLRRAGWERITIFAEPNSQVPDNTDGVEWRQNATVLGPLPNWQQCFKWSLDAKSEMILLAEDDLAVCRGLRRFVEQHAPRDGIVSLIRSERFDPGKSVWTPFDWTKYEWYWLAQALVFPRAVAERYAASDIFRNQWPGPKQGDIGLGEWCKQTGTPLYVPTPSFVQHVGTLHFGSWSSAWDHAQNGFGTQASDFVGEEFDLAQAS